MRTYIVSFSSTLESPLHSEFGRVQSRQQLECRIGDRQSGLYEAAVFDERIGYLMGGPGTGAAAEAFSLDPKNGERISANLPRINTEGAMPTI